MRFNTVILIIFTVAINIVLSDNALACRSCEYDDPNADHPAYIKEALAKKTQEEAVSRLMDALETEHLSASEYETVGFVLFNILKSPSNAVVAYRMAVSGDPNSFEYRLSLAQAYESSGDTESAINTLKAYIEEYPNQQDGYAALALLYTYLGKFDAALECYEKAAGLEGFDKYESVARLLAGLGRYEEATVYFEKWLDYLPKMAADEGYVVSAMDHLYLVHALALSGKTDDALAKLDRIAKEFPDDPLKGERWAEEEELYVYILSGMYDVAFEYAMSNGFGPNVTVPLLLIMDKPEQALVVLKTDDDRVARDGYPVNKYTEIELKACVLIYMDKLDEALKLIQSARKGKCSGAYRLIDLERWVFIAKGDYAKAVEAIETENKRDLCSMAVETFAHLERGNDSDIEKAKEILAEMRTSRPVSLDDAKISAFECDEEKATFNFRKAALISPEDLLLTKLDPVLSEYFELEDLSVHLDR